MKLNKKQKEALEDLILNLDELDNKPRRLFSALIDFTKVFVEDSDDIIDRLDDAQLSYYSYWTQPDLLAELLYEITKKEKKLTSTKRLKEKAKHYEVQSYKIGVEDGSRKIREAISKILVDKMNTY